jgi:hypothetical protein
MLISAIKNGDIRLVRHLIADGARVNEPCQVGDEVCSPLQEAAFSGFPGIGEVLIQAGANVNALSSKNKIPLHDAIDNLHMTQLLIRHGSLLEVHDNQYGDTPFHRAARIGNVAVIQVLLNAGADVLAENFRGEMPLYCVRFGDRSIMNIMFDSLSGAQNMDPFLRMTVLSTRQSRASIISTLRVNNRKE